MLGVLEGSEGQGFSVGKIPVPLPLPLAKGMGFPRVRGSVFAKWWEGGEHHCGRCNYQSPGYSLCKKHTI